MSRHGEGQPHVHTRRIPLYRRIEEFFDLGESYDFIKLPQYVLPGHAQNRAVDENIFPPRQLRMKTCSDFQQTRHPPANTHPPFGRFGDPAKYFQERRLARPVTANDPHHLALLHFEGNIFESPEFFLSWQSAKG